MGGAVGNEICDAIAIDVEGNVVITGGTYSYQNDLAYKGFDNTYGGGLLDAFVAKFDSNGNRLWASYLGGNDSDRGYGIAVNSGGEIYVTGSTLSSNAIGDKGADVSFNGYADAFLTKISSSGTLIWSSYYGGEGLDVGKDLIIDDKGNVLMIGSTWSENGIAFNGFDNKLAGSKGGHIGGSDDAFLVKFDSDGNRIWGTYFGGDIVETGEVITLDNKGNIYFSGITHSETEVAHNGFDMKLGGYYDVYLAKFDSDGNRIWVTYFGGKEGDEIFGLDTDEKGDVYLVGQTLSQDGIVNEGFDTQFDGERYTFNGFIAKYHPQGQQVWSSYYNKIPFAISTLTPDSFYVSGYVDYLVFIGNESDAFLAKVSIESRKFAYITGSAFIDANENCIKDEDEKPMPNIVIYTKPSWFSATTDSQGNFTIKADTGSYVLKQYLTSDQKKFIQSICENADSVARLTKFNDSARFDIGIKTIVTGINDTEIPFELYPNPTEGSVTVMGSFVVSQVGLYDSKGIYLGELKFENMGDGYRFTIDAESGFYIVLIKTSKGVLHSKVIVK